MTNGLTFPALVHLVTHVNVGHAIQIRHVSACYSRYSCTCSCSAGVVAAADVSTVELSL